VVAFQSWAGLFLLDSTYSEDTDDAQINGHLIQNSSPHQRTAIKINVDENQFGTKGTVIAKLDPPITRSAVEKRSSRVASAQPPPPRPTSTCPSRQ